MTRPGAKTVLAGIFLGFLAIIAALALYLLPDEAPPEDSDLLPRRRPLPEAENGFALLEDLAVDLSISEEDDSILEPFGEAWRPEAARAAVARNAEALEKYERFLEKGVRLQVPEVTGMDARFPYLPPWRNLAQLVSMRIALLAEDGKEREALEECGMLARFGRAIERADGGIIVFLVGANIEGRGVDGSMEVLARSRRPAAESRKCADTSVRIPSRGANVRGERSGKI